MEEPFSEATLPPSPHQTSKAGWPQGASLVAAAEPEWVSESEVPAYRRLAVGAHTTREMEEERPGDQQEQQQGRMHQACYSTNGGANRLRNGGIGDVE